MVQLDFPQNHLQLMKWLPRHLHTLFWKMGQPHPLGSWYVHGMNILGCLFYMQRNCRPAAPQKGHTRGDEHVRGTYIYMRDIYVMGTISRGHYGRRRDRLHSFRFDTGR